MAAAPATTLPLVPLPIVPFDSNGVDLPRLMPAICGPPLMFSVPVALL